MSDSSQELFDAPANPRQHAILLSVLFFCYAFKSYRIGKKRNYKFEEEDVFRVLDEDTSKILGDKLEVEWNKQLLGKKPSLVKALYNAFKRPYWKFSALRVLTEMLRVSDLVCVYHILEGYQRIEKNYSQIYTFTGIFMGATLLKTLINQNMFLGTEHVGQKLIISCSTLIYRKCLQVHLEEDILGHIINVISNDTYRLLYTILNLPHFTSLPFVLIVTITLGYYYLGLTCFVTLLLILCDLPIQVLCGRCLTKIRERVCEKTDTRITIMNEMISNIKVIKMNVWENIFFKVIQEARASEMKEIRKILNIKVISLSIPLIGSRLVLLGTFLVYFTMNDKIQPLYSFPLVVYSSILRTSLSQVLPAIIIFIADVHASIRRMSNVLLRKEFKKTAALDSNMSGIFVTNVSTKWNDSQPEYILENINLISTNPELIAIIGEVGSGKSTLLHVILGELPALIGQLKVYGTISYASQDPWIFAGTIRENIIFGSDFDHIRYQQVIDICCLKEDLDSFTFGDRTLVGGRNVSLSGGQRARVNLARAVYKESLVYLLDDPLASVDTMVAKNIFSKCIKGFLKDKIVLLVTHQQQFLQLVDRIVIIQNRNIIFDGKFKNLAEVAPEYISSVDFLEEENLKIGLFRHRSKSLMQLPELGQAIIKEEMKEGGIKKRVYLTYLRASSKLIVSVGIFFLFILTQIILSVCEYFIKPWINSGGTSNIYLIVYIIIIAVLIVIMLLRSIFFFTFCMKASIYLHNTMFLALLKAPLSFFESHSPGQILNRFSKDISIVDESLPLQLFDTIQILLQMIGVFTITCILNHFLVIAASILLILGLIFRNYYLKVSRGIRRIEGIKRSPLYNHVSSSLEGVATIRAFGVEWLSIKLYEKYQNAYSSSFYWLLFITRSFAFYLDLMCTGYFYATCMLFTFFNSKEDNSAVGLALTQILSIGVLFQFGVRQLTEIENQMTAVERICDYITVPPEVTKKKQKTQMTIEGRIEFKSVTLKLGEELILKNLDFKIDSKEKIGVIGRTGAGKSSLISALFQLSPTGGRILIDGIDTKNIPLETLRSNLTIIPQDPILFTGTLRKNLDPFEEHKDYDLWQVLKDVEMLDAVFRLPNGLSSIIKQGGNFSVGQKQLLCLARAIMKKNKIVILDEATSNLDPQTDDIVQEIIKKHFSDCTVITIAHRLNSIATSDKVLVLHKGEIVEYDHPFILLQKMGMFYDLVNLCGPSTASKIKQIAAENYYIKFQNVNVPSSE